MSITADKIPEVFEQQNINNRAVTPLPSILYSCFSTHKTVYS